MIVSVDGTRAALRPIVDRKLLATVGSTPRLGPKAFETMARDAKGEMIKPWGIIADGFFNKSNAAQLISEAY